MSTGQDRYVPQPLDAALEARVRRLPKAELHFHFEGAFRWSTIRELHPHGTALPERAPWLPCVRPFAVLRGWISGIDLQGDERLGEQRAFVDVYRRAATLRLKLRAHAGEICGAQNVRDAAVLCGVQDISHGVRAIDDPALVRELARTGVCLHVCPTSNVLLAVARDYASHPLRRLCDAGVRCTVNSDDPLPFGTDIKDEYRVLLRDMGFSLREVGTFAKNAFAASLLDPATQATLCAEVDQVVA